MLRNAPLHVTPKTLNKPSKKSGGWRWPAAFTIRREDFNLTLLAKALLVLIFSGPIIVPILWLADIGWSRPLADLCWALGRSFCTYTVKSFEIGGVPMMVCSRCFGAAGGMLAAGFLYFYTPLKSYLPKRKLYLAAFLAALFVPWLIDSGVETLQLWNWHTDHWLMLPTGFLGGVAVALSPLLFWPQAEKEADPL